MSTPSDVTPGAGPAPIRDQRRTPPGVLPRQLQMWLMIGLAVIILGIILVTGRTASSPRSIAVRPTDPTLLAPERIQAYQQQLADGEARLRAELTRAATAAPGTRSTTSGGQGAAPADPLADERRRRDYQSLFADNVAFTRRSGDLAAGRPPSAAPPSSPVSTGPTDPKVNAEATEPAPAGKDTDPIRSSVARQRLTEGTVIETVLINRLNGTFAGPVECLVTTPVYSHDRQQIVIPAGARVLGQAAPVQAWGDSRLAVSFHRLVLPDGRTHSLDQFKGLNQIGETGLKDEVNRHYLQVFGASVAIGALSGLAQYGSSGSIGTTGFGDQYRQAAGASLAASSGRVLDRYLNVLPTITIHEGYRIKVYLTNDLELPPYTPTATGGDQ
ncbi:MAG: TrbI/VirB10 family protein [Vicinamibacterales bacterium]